jgi:hypothetical protein
MFEKGSGWDTNLHTKWEGGMEYQHHVIVKLCPGEGGGVSVGARWGSKETPG